MTETLIGVPEKIQHNFEAYSKANYGTTYKHKVLFIDGTKAQVHTKKKELENFKIGEECQYHVLEHLKDGVEKIKYGEPWTGSVPGTPVDQYGNKSEFETGLRAPNITEIDGIKFAPNPTVENAKDNLIARQVCVKAAAVVVAASSQRWQVIAEEMYKWVLKESAPKLDWHELPKEEDEDLPF